jgi:hypothetical protein
MDVEVLVATIATIVTVITGLFAWFWKHSQPELRDAGVDRTEAFIQYLTKQVYDYQERNRRLEEERQSTAARIRRLEQELQYVQDRNRRLEEELSAIRRGRRDNLESPGTP